MIRKIHLVAAATAAVLCAACDTHIDVPDTAVRPGHILCEDGTALPYAQYEQSGKKAIAVVFDTEKRGDTEGDGYAVYLWDIAPQAFADSLGIAQGTSADIMAYDGNENTFALYDTQETASPMAEAVFDLWRYGQSAYVPSVAEMRLLYTMRKIINPVIEHNTIKEVAYALAFENISYFNKVFRKILNKTPTEYKKEMIAFT
jgi:AraC-like DNA-binding protein